MRWLLLKGDIHSGSTSVQWYFQEWSPPNNSNLFSVTATLLSVYVLYLYTLYNNNLPATAILFV